MNKIIKKIAWLLVSLTAFFISSLVDAAPLPKFALIPTIATTFDLSTNSTALVQYVVVNQTTIMRTLTIVPLVGVTQLTTQGTCPSPFVLVPNQSCLLTLQITGSQMPTTGIHGGPIVCKTEGPGNNSPDPFLCSQPSAAASLNITSVPRPSQIFIISPAQSERIISVSPFAPLSIVIGNDPTSPRAAHNVRAILPPTWSDVTQDASDCISLAPGASCTLNLNSTGPHEPGQITITGTNTFPITTYVAFRDGGGLVFSTVGGIVKVANETSNGTSQWGNPLITTGATDLHNGMANTMTIVSTPGIGPNAALVCTSFSGGGYNDWYLPAICELSRYVPSAGNIDPGCGNTTPNLYSTLNLVGFGNFVGFDSIYWSSTEYSPSPTNAWAQDFNAATLTAAPKSASFQVRCIRAF